MPRLSVVIPTKDRPVELKRMLDSLDKQTYRDFEVIVVDGNKFPGGLVVQENVGLGLATGEIYIRTDDDAEAHPEWLENIVKTFDSYSYVGGVTGPTVYSDMSTRDIFKYQDKLRNGNWLWRLIGKVYYDYILEGKVDEVGKVVRSGAFTLGSNYPLAFEKLRSVDVHDCCTLAVRTHLLREIGGFDEGYKGVGDLNEPDVSFRIRQLGKEFPYRIIFNPECWIIHHASRSGIFDARQKCWDRLYNFRRFHKKFFKFNLRYLVYLWFQIGYYIYVKFHNTRS